MPTGDGEGKPGVGPAEVDAVIDSLYRIDSFLRFDLIDTLTRHAEVLEPQRDWHVVVRECRALLGGRGRVGGGDVAGLLTVIADGLNANLNGLLHVLREVAGARRADPGYDEAPYLQRVNAAIDKARREFSLNFGEVRARLLAGGGPAAAGPAPSRYVFRRHSADGWAVSFGSDPAQYVVEDLAGLDYIAQLLGSPGVPVSDVRLCGTGDEPAITSLENQRTSKLTEDEEFTYYKDQLMEAAEMEKSPNAKIREKGRENREAIGALLAKLGTGKGPPALDMSNHKRAQTAVDKALDKALKRLRPVAAGALEAHLRRHVVKPPYKGYHHVYEKPFDDGWEVSRFAPRTTPPVLPGG